MMHINRKIERLNAAALRNDNNTKYAAIPRKVDGGESQKRKLQQNSRKKYQ